MIREIRTRAALVEFIDAGEGYLYNDFGGRNPKLCPIHHGGCRSLARMLSVPEGELSVHKLCSPLLADLVAEVIRLGKVHSFCGNEPGLASGASHAFRTPAVRPTPTTSVPCEVSTDDPFGS